MSYVDAPPTSAYGPPALDFSQLANLANTFYQGAQNRQQYNLERAFQGGVPRDASGNPDYRAIMMKLAQMGDVNAIKELAPQVQQQQQMQEARSISPLLGGNQSDQPPGQIPPASIGAVQTGPSGSPNSSPGENIGVAPSINDLAAKAGVGNTVAANLAKALKVQPDDPLNAQQWQQAQKYLSAYASRNHNRDSGDTRGDRNNNPDNIEAGHFASTQVGYIGPEPQGRFATFSSPQAGITAASNLLNSYGKQGINTINGIVQKWAPASDGNNDQAYAAFVSQQLGVSPNQPLNMADPQVRNALATAMAKYENGAYGAGGVANRQPQRAINRPVIPQVPLPNGFTDPQQAIIAIDREIARLGTNPMAQEQIAALEDYRNRIQQSYQPIPVRAGETLLNPSTGQPFYEANPTNPMSALIAQWRQDHPDATPQEEAAFIQSMRSGRSAISMYMTHYLEENPNATADDVKRAAQLYTTQTTAQNRFLSGPQGNTIRSLNVVVSHLQTMQDLGDALQNGNIRLFNEIGQRWSQETGDPAPTSFDTAKQIVGAEIIKALGVAGAGTQTEREEAANAFNRASSPQQLSKAIEAARRLLIGQLQGLRRQYVAATGLPGDSFDQMLEPQTREFFGDGGSQETQTQEQPMRQSSYSVGQTATNPKTGQKIKWDGQKWVPVTNG